MGWREFFFGVDGRLGRLGYARGVVMANVYAQFCFVLACFTGIAAGRLGVLPFLLMFLGIWPAVALTVRRLHDRGKTGWWAIPFLIGPFALEVALALLNGSQLPRGAVIAANLLIGLAVLILWLWSAVELWWIPGQRGPNRFGPDTLPRKTSPA